MYVCRLVFPYYLHIKDQKATPLYISALNFGTIQIRITMKQKKSKMGRTFCQEWKNVLKTSCLLRQNHFIPEISRLNNLRYRENEIIFYEKNITTQYSQFLQSIFLY